MKFASNEEVAPNTSCKKVKHANLINLGEKNNQAQHKKTAKNKASRQIHIQTQKINQQANARTIDFARRISKHATKPKNCPSKMISSLILQILNQKKVYEHKRKSKHKEKTFFE